MKSTDEQPTPISIDDLASVQGGRLPPGIDEALAEGEKEAQKPSGPPRGFMM